MQHVLVADIGGTNARFALFAIAHSVKHSVPLPTPFSEKSTLSLATAPTLLATTPTLFTATATSRNPCHLSSLTLLAHTEYPCKDFATFTDLLITLKNDVHALNITDFSTIQSINIAAAGSIHKNTCKFTNLPWVINAEEIRNQLHIPNIVLFNDFIAQGYAGLVQKELQSSCLQRGIPHKNSPIAVIGAGTGLGKAVLLYEDKKVLASEGGQSLFPFSGKEEYEYVAFLSKKLQTSEIIQDAVVSGRGLEMLFTYHTKQEKRAEEISLLFDTYPIVLEWFARFYARVCRQFVLDTYALGGLIITGGIATKTPVLQHPTFLNTFHESPVQGHILQQIPIHHMQHPHAGLYGAALASFYR